MPKTTHYSQITDLLTAGKLREAMSVLDASGTELPEVERLECVGNYHFYRHEQQHAVDCYEQALRLDPTYGIARWQYIVGVKSERAGDFVGAFERYRSAIDIEPTFVDAYVEMGGLLAKVGELAVAAECYERALALEREDLTIYHNLRAVYAELAKQDPGKYGHRHHEVDALYKEAAGRLPQPGRDHLW
jgi:tetratricopeptide (TPR) repeat protein